MPTDSENQRLFLRALDAVRELAHEFTVGEGELPQRDVPPRELGQRLGLTLTESGVPFEQVVETLRCVLAETPSAASPRFLNQLFGGRDPAATMAEMLVPLANTSMYTYKVAGAQVMVEQEVLRKMLAVVPYPDGEGMFSPGGSLANMTAMLIARNRALAGVRDDGLSDQRPAIYTSSDAHYSIRKAAGILGLGRASVREVPTDSRGSMEVAELEQMIVGDRDSGFTPILINATVGTTVLGAIDPLDDISVVARRYGVWLHVDGALGGSLLLARSYRQLLSGIEDSDSLAWNAHKLMGVPLACSILLLRQKGLLAEHLGESAGYLFQADESELNPGTRSLQCGRRNDGLKLWAAWKHLGDDGFDRRLTHLIETARYAARLIDDDPDLELVTEPQTVCVCFRVRGRSSAEVCDYLDRRAILKIGHGRVGGQGAIRLVCVDPELDRPRVETTIQLIKSVAAELD